VATETITATVSFVDYLILPVERSQNLLVRNRLEMHDITRYIVTAVSWFSWSFYLSITQYF